MNKALLAMPAKLWGCFVLTACGTFDVHLPKPPHNGPDGSTSGPTADGGDVDGCSYSHCGATCVDTNTNPAHCGTCDHACAPGDVCTNGKCALHAMAVTAGEGFACMVRQEGTVWCWGSNQYAELGAAPAAVDAVCAGAYCSPTPRQVPGLTDVVAVRAGSSFACAVKTDGSVWCWGKNAFGVLGHSNASDASCSDPSDAGTTSKCNPAPSKVDFPAGILPDSLVAGWDVACAIASAGASDAADPAGDVYCWGRNDHDSVGIAGSDPDSVPVPHKIDGFAGDVVAVSVGDGSRHVCAVRRDTTVWCWGDDFQGRMGVVPGVPPQIDCPPFTNHCSAVPRQVHVQVPPADADAGDLGLGEDLTLAERVQVGDGASCVLRADGSIWCWGNNGAAALSIPGPFVGDVDHPGARRIGGFPAAIVGFVRHFRTTLAVTSSGAWWGLGENSYGELGATVVLGEICMYGLCAAKPLPLPNLRGVTKLAGGDQFFVGLDANNVVLAWGRNDRGQLGHLPGADGDMSGMGTDAVVCNPTPSPVGSP